METARLTTKEEDLRESLIRTCDAVAEAWFLLGLYHGTCLAKKDKEGLENLDNKIKFFDEKFHTFYKKIIAGAHGYLEIKMITKLNSEGNEEIKMDAH